jgi:hypothetical protein
MSKQRVSLIGGMFMPVYLRDSPVSPACSRVSISLSRSVSGSLSRCWHLLISFFLCHAGTILRTYNHLHQLWAAHIFLAGDVPSMLLSLRHPHYDLPQRCYRTSNVILRYTTVTPTNTLAHIVYHTFLHR